MDRQVIVRNARLAWEEYLKTLDLENGSKLVPIGGFPAYLDSLVSEDETDKGMITQKEVEYLKLHVGNLPIWSNPLHWDEFIVILNSLVSEDK